MILPAPLVVGSICEFESSLPILLISAPLSRVDTSIGIVVNSQAMHFILLPVSLVELIACWPLQLVWQYEFPVALLYLDALDELPVPFVNYSI